MRKYYPLYVVLLISSCVNIGEYNYVKKTDEATTKLIIEDTYAAHFPGMPLFTRYLNFVRIYDSNQGCPYSSAISNASERAGYLGKVTLTKKNPIQTINIEKTRHKYIDIHRKIDIANTSKWCNLTLRLDINPQNSYHLKFDGEVCSAELYTTMGESEALVVSNDMVSARIADERLCAK